ncbi:MAG: RHS repeat-associated core domain-containing protein, partial [Monoglobaceae bacterium]
TTKRYVLNCERQKLLTAADASAEYYTRDPHGSITSLGSRSYTYDAFGNETEDNTTDENPFRYCGEYYDAESGLIYLRNRYYDPSVGRFISEDPAKDGSNWYAYCGNNPVMFVDPLGLRSVMLRYAIEKVGGYVSYDEETGTATAYFDGKSVEYSGEIINGRMISVRWCVLDKQF